MIRVIIPSFNCAKWIGRAMATVAVQSYKDYDVLVVDDASEQQMQREIIVNTCSALGWKYQLNERNMRAGYNLYTGIHSMDPDPDDVVFILDGDDYLPHSEVFTRIAGIYEDPDIWFSYGQYEPYPYNTGQVPASAYTEEQIDMADHGYLRNTPSLVNHPISFRYWLFCQLTEKDMKNDKGHWFRAGYDRVMFVPMLEMAGHHHYFCEDILYVYNSVNPISDSTASLPEVHEAHRAVQSRPPRRKLDGPIH